MNGPTEEQLEKYNRAMHGVQSAIKFLIDRGDDLASPKHLRVGIHSALVNDHAISTLLIEKGIITEEEYFDQLVESAEQELEYLTVMARDYCGNQNLHFG